MGLVSLEGMEQEKSIVTKVNEILPKAKILKLRGYSSKNYSQKYDDAKKPTGKTWEYLESDLDISRWLASKGWVGVVIPENRIVVDVDENATGELLNKLLRKEGYLYHCIKTPKGFQFIFKASEESTKLVKQISKYYTQVGVVIDTRTTEKGYIVFPAEKTENRYFLSQSEVLDELPFFLCPVMKKKDDYEFPLPLEKGSRNDTLYKFACRLNVRGIPREEAFKSMKLIYEYFVLDKTDFPEKEVDSLTNSAFKWEPNSINPAFLTNEQNKNIVCLQNTQVILNMLNVTVYYDVIKKRSFMESENKNFSGYIMDYHAIRIMDFAINQGYKINKNLLIDHLMTLARNNSINKITHFLEQAKNKWDGISRMEDVFNTLHCRTDRKLALAYFKKWCIQAVRLAGNTDGKMNQEFVLVLQGEQGNGKTSWFKSLFPINEYFKEGLELNPENKDIVLECISHFLVELGELDATMKHEQARIKAFITKSMDEVRKPFERLSEIAPRQTVLCATVNEETFLKDKTGNRRYAVIKTGDKIDRLDHIDLEQFWGEVSSLAANGETHHLNDEEKEQQKNENNDYETLNEAEIRVELNFDWEADKKLWRNLSAAKICDVLGLPAKSKNVAQALKKRGCVYHDKKRPREWTVPPFINNYSKILPSGMHPTYKD
ncbi:primase C-terminal domain-containing protein [Niallia taxi]|uniref:VapE domain-containing protein n=1 Tax=Niallia taxi TaxID=2499688 RepID=UPI00293502A2|nr:VapE domain-containing protein [Niallia taxi]WOD63880.1 primase C-terminal domain-containing protein [Niallia taxi]